VQGVTLLAVQLSVDAGHARIPYAIEAPHGAERERPALASDGLVRASPFLRARLAQQLDLKRTPKLTFVFVGMTGGAAWSE
jgi:ribosome-binding factor A